MKKIFIVILILVALLLVIIHPSDMYGMIVDLSEDYGYFAAYIISFYFIASTLLFWVGVPAGWRFAVNCSLGIIGRLIFAYIGMALSLPIALVQLLKK